MYYERYKAESEAQSGKPKGTLESEIRIAMLLLGQRPPRYAGVGRSCSIAESISWEMRACEFMLARSDTGAGQPVALIRARMAVVLAKRKPRCVRVRTVPHGPQQCGYLRNRPIRRLPRASVSVARAGMLPVLIMRTSLAPAPGIQT